MEGRKLLWGDFHTHFERFDIADDIMRGARDNIDFYAVLCYPFAWDVKNGFRVESVGQRPEFLEWWKIHHRLAAEYNDPGTFTTFLGYEWHGNRTRWGDHNVIYRDGVGELDPTADIAELYEKLRGKPAFAIPHHTAYRKGRRGKDFDVWDRELSPVMEVCSAHGSSEGADTPRDMIANSSMGPRMSGGAFEDALKRGIRIGVIGSNDGGGLPGRWNQGRAAVWAEDCTREAIWEAISARRTYAVTGDRIELDFSVGGVPMGSEAEMTGTTEAEVSVVASSAVDRIELLHNEIVIDTCCHSGTWERNAASGKRFKMRFVAGWGPCTAYGYDPPERWHWDCSMDVAGGELVGVEKCIDQIGQHVKSVKPNRCEWELSTAARKIRDPFGMTQGLVFEITGTADTRLHFEIEGKKFDATVREMIAGSQMIPLIEESKCRVLETFGLDEEAVGPNPDSYHHNARKFKVHRAIPQEGYTVKHTFGDIKLARGSNCFRVRVRQTNGQLAWSSPVWIDCPGAADKVVREITGGN